jgi:hypothetical protein
MVLVKFYVELPTKGPAVIMGGHCGFLSPSREVMGLYLKICHNNFLPDPSVIQHCII